MRVRASWLRERCEWDAGEPVDIVFNVPFRPLVIIYLPTFSEMWAWDFYPGSAGNFEHDTIISEDSRRSPKFSEVSRSLSTRLNARSLPVLFPWKIRDCEEVIVIYSFYTWFSFLTWVWVFFYFWKLCQARRQQLTFFNQAWEIGPQAWAGVRLKFSTRRRETHA